ncbi:MAG: hypothetical protein PHI91_02620 [Candidatus Pacebacteria bacterium]|nr:hypothetical protein [Candidatus Paceibacterota bacterium]MDD2757402.1 hypothetical protein [Candidatus Paceibacterota bacterium]MDD3970059.1 hypothetical protein [Candidatus Paceibacterota bacterium]
MNFLQNFFNKLNELIYRNTCQTLFNSYKKSEKLYPDASERELCAMTLSFRPTYKKDIINPYVFIKDGRIITIQENDKIKNLIIKVIMTENSPGFANPREDMKLMVKISLIVDEELNKLEK